MTAFHRYLTSLALLMMAFDISENPYIAYDSFHFIRTAPTVLIITIQRHWPLIFIMIAPMQFIIALQRYLTYFALQRGPTFLCLRKLILRKSDIEIFLKVPLYKKRVSLSKLKKLRPLKLERSHCVIKWSRLILKNGFL